MKKKVLVLVYWCNPKKKEVKVLLLKRKFGVKGIKGAWQAVTGNLEEGETYEEAALREAKEESSFSFLEKPQDLHMDYKFLGSKGKVLEKVYSLEVHAEEIPSPILEEKEHSEYSWLEPIEAYEKLPFPKQKEAVFKAFYKPSPFLLRKDGIWFQDGQEISHQRSSDLLHYSLMKGKKEGEFFIRIGDSEVPAIVESAPLHISRVERKREVLCLVPHGKREFPLDPKSIFIDKDNSMYCYINGMKARFSRQAYYELCKQIKEKKLSDGGLQYLLHWGGKDYLVPIAN